MTLQQLNDLEPCSEGMAFARKCGSVRKAWEQCERSDWMMWYLRVTDALTKEQSVTLAIGFASRTIPRWEEKHPDDTRPQQAIDSAQAWLANPCEETRTAAYASYAASAAYASYAAAYAADGAAAHAASSAAYAAYAASSAASAASYASYAAYAADGAAAHAADAAVYAAYDADAASAAAVERKWQCDFIRKTVNPFSK